MSDKASASAIKTSDPKQLAAARKELIALSTNLARITQSPHPVTGSKKDR